LETNYTSVIRDLKGVVKKEKQRFKSANSDKITKVTNQNELETLFVSCVEEVRKDIMNRRLKNEIYN
jgi:hypothetical protein